MPNALITGASVGLGRAIAHTLAQAGWSLTIDARSPRSATDAPSRPSARLTAVRAVARRRHRPGPIARAARRGHRDRTARPAGQQRQRARRIAAPAACATWTPTAYERLLADQRAGAPAAGPGGPRPAARPGAVIINISSDAGVEHYESWGGYGSTKAALDHQTLTWAAEEPQFTWYAVDPGDLRTAMHQAAFPGEDISDRPEPESVAPVIADLISSGLPSGRYRAADLADSPSRRRVPHEHR